MIHFGMAGNLRIVFNVFATYGRSLYSLLLGLFTARWVLLTLGRVDYGLYGIVAGLTVLVGFLTFVLSASVARFYSVNVGADSVNENSANVEVCRKWFSVAVVIHAILPLLLMVLMYPLGCFMVRFFLDIPGDRIKACIWVWRFSCAGWFIGVSTIPFYAMYVAKQEIAELTIYSFASTTATACFIYYMYCHPGFWLVRYALVVSAFGIVPQIIIAVRACCKYKECRFEWRYAIDTGRIKQLLSFSVWQAFGTAANVLRGQGVAIIINKFFGPSVNAATSVGMSMANHCGSLSLSMASALTPAIMNAYGANQLERMERLVYAACKIGSMALVVFAIPLVLEIREVLVLWLKDPPPYSSGWCICVLTGYLLDKFVMGHTIAIAAYGRIKKFNLIANGSLLLILPLACVIVVLGGGVYSVGLTITGMMLVRTLLIVALARSLANLSFRYWLYHVLCPLGVVIVVGLAAGFVLRCCMQASLMRVCVISIVANIAMIIVGWICLFNDEDRMYIQSKLNRALSYIR